MRTPPASPSAMLILMEVRAVLQAFWRYSLVGVTAFLFDLALLAFLVELLSTPYQIAVPFSFLVVTTVQHGVTRTYVFPSSERTYRAEYMHFLAIAIATVAIVTLLTVGLVEHLSFDIYVARVIGAAVGGLWSFYANAHFNFRIFGKKPLL